MEAKEVISQLEQIAYSEDFAVRTAELTEKWSDLPDACNAVEPILRFMENHPSLDYGVPGALVHFAERFLGQGYEQKLVESIRMKPSSQTLWMLNRLINGTDLLEVRKGLIKVMKEASLTHSADSDARRDASRFLDRLLQPE